MPSPYLIGTGVVIAVTALAFLVRPSKATVKDTVAKCPSKETVEALTADVKAGKVAAGPAEEIAAKWESEGCSGEAAVLRAAIKAAAPTLNPITKVRADHRTAKPPGLDDLDGPPAETKPPPSDSAPTSPLAGWPKVQALPESVYSKVYPIVSKVQWAKLWTPDATLIEICPFGCTAADLATAWKIVEVEPVGGLGGMTEAARDAAIDELKLAASRLVTKEPSTAGLGARKRPPHMVRRR